MRATVTVFIASAPSDEVSGASIRAYLSALGFYATRGQQILAEQGIPEVDPARWYPWQAYLNAQRALYERVGPHTLGRIGRRLVDEADFPPEIDSIDAALSTLDADYHARHRGRDVGYFRYQRTGERSATVAIANPYPCELDKNVVEALCRRFKPADALSVYVRHGEEGCRNQGAAACVLHVHW